MTKIVVHGADSFVGASLSAHLSMLAGLQVYNVRGADASELKQALPGAEAVAHCIVGSPQMIASGAAALYGQVEGIGPRPRVVHLGSMSVYGGLTGIVDESSPTTDELGPYAIAQLNAEKSAAAHGAVILRCGVEYGPYCEAWSGRVARWLYARRVGDLGESGDGVCNVLFIRDLATAIAAALRTPGLEGQVLNVASAEKPTWNEYFVAFGIALGAVPVRRIGARQLKIESKLLAPPLKILELLASKARLKTPPPIPPSLLRVCRQDIVLSAARAERALELHWTSLEEGLRQAALCYRM